MFGHQRAVHLPALSHGKDATAASPYAISDWERGVYYHGISLGNDHPKLLYRSDLLDTPLPGPEGRWKRPVKTAHGVFNTPLNAVWHTVAPLIRDLLKKLKIRYSAFKAARFLTHGDYQTKNTLGPVVLWIATHPGTTTAENAYDASPKIISLLEANGVEGVVVEWYEGAAEKLASSALPPVTDTFDPTHHVRRFLTAALGMPIDVAEREGSVALFFHETKDKNGNPSDKVFGVSNCHVLRGNTTVELQFKESSADAQYVRVSGSRRFQRGLDEIKDCIWGCGINADLFGREIVELELRPKIHDPERVAKVVEAKRTELAQVKKDGGGLEAFYYEAKSQWGDIAHRTIGRVDWAPEITVDVYTRDIGTFLADPTRFKAHFKGNVVDLGALDFLFHI